MALRTIAVAEDSDRLDGRILSFFNFLWRKKPVYRPHNLLIFFWFDRLYRWLGKFRIPY
jgi:hypothetical protein